MKVLSYDLYLQDPVTHDTLHMEKRHLMRGGTFCMGGTTEMWINITFNYGGIFARVLGKCGIKKLNGMTAAESIPLVKTGISYLGDDVTENYWDATDGNAKRALYQVLALAQMRPDGVWHIIY